MLEFFSIANDNEKLVINRMDDNSYRELAQSLNREQMEVFYHVSVNQRGSESHLVNTKQRKVNFSFSWCFVIRGKKGEDIILPIKFAGNTKHLYFRSQ